MFGFDEASWATGGVAAVFAAAGVALALVLGLVLALVRAARRWRHADDDTIDWDVGGDIV